MNIYTETINKAEIMGACVFIHHKLHYLFG